ncbi:helix-turn-helix domain-containing protein [Mycobacterium sp. Aquia_213]|uniref:helix-turn-helix domain-containing protein n=1 Tax=Mycobacterium sp. Aquia_213 TaxID=2991728 RepID=UPI00226D7530|nr:helix-turn-helix domain-containing protein [Mycobacterium sp. Aquia_213]WAC89923.1 helix-turn-helix domain-containing protein [Mycobacterium sp. Aquia_213]
MRKHRRAGRRHRNIRGAVHPDRRSYRAHPRRRVVLCRGPDLRSPGPACGGKADTHQTDRAGGATRRPASGRRGFAVSRRLLYQRVLLAQRLLEESELSIDDIARRAGFRNGVTLRRHFRRQVGTSPLHYRMKFRPRTPLAAECG